MTDSITKLLAKRFTRDEEGAIGVATELLQHPLSQRFLRKMELTGDNRVFSPADVLGERLVRAASWLVFAAREPEHLLMNVDRDENKLFAAMAIVGAALQSAPYLWTEEVRQSVAPKDSDIENFSLPRHTLSSTILPDRSMWWTFQTGVILAAREEHGYDVTVDAMIIRDYVEGFESIIIGESNDVHASGKKPFIDVHRYPYGNVYPDDFTDADSMNLTGILAFLGFLNSPYIPKIRNRLSRPERREIFRGKADDFGEEVTFVMLRRPDQKRSSASEQIGTIEWKHRWIVGGHYRAQWYPSEQAHHVIWIPPYIKGPSDKPMIEHVYKVAR
jgi:hypothetical protein